MEFAQIRDRVDVKPKAGAMNTSDLIGTWINSNPNTSGIARIVISSSGEKLSLRAYAVSPEGLIDWGSVDINAFASTPTSDVAAGFMCLYDLGFAEARLQAMIMKGLLVLAQLQKFKDDSGRVDYFVREYFAIVHEHY